MKLTEQEREQGRLSDDRLEAVVTAFEVAGMAAIETAVDIDVVARLREAVHRYMDPAEYTTFQTLDGRDTKVGCSFFPFVDPFNDPAIVAHPVLLQVLRAIVGDEAVCRIYNTNLSLPSSLPQPVHVDIPSVLEDGSLRTTPCVSVHILLTDFTDENGSTEIWPGTQRRPTLKESLAELARLAPELPSVRTNHPAGTITLRDPSAWHRGNANTTDTSRDMLTMFFAPRGTVYAESVFGRALDIDRDTLEGLPADARSVWEVNLVDA